MKRHMVLVPALLVVAMPALALAAGRPGAPAAVTGSAAAKARKPGVYKQPIPPFSKADTNGDHAIEWKEAKPVGVPKAVFERYDYHHDGKLTLTEWKMVKVAMVHTVNLSATGSKSLPAVPASVARKVHAPAYGTVTGTTSAPAHSTSGHGGN